MNTPDGNINSIVIIIAHHSRRDNIPRIMAAVAPMACVVVMDEKDHGALWNHKRALKVAYDLGRRAIFMEDDAEPVKNFAAKAREWIEAFPDDLISFYLGTGRPVMFQEKIGRMISEGCASLRIGTLIHGVCYTMPVREVGRVLRGIKPNLPADYAIGNAFGRSVLYPTASLVDHEDSEPAEKFRSDGEQRTERRKAWKLDNR